MRIHNMPSKTTILFIACQILDQTSQFCSCRNSLINAVRLSINSSNFVEFWLTWCEAGVRLAALCTIYSPGWQKRHLFCYRTFWCSGWARGSGRLAAGWGTAWHRRKVERNGYRWGIIGAIDKVKTKLEWELQDQKYKLTAYSAESDSHEGVCSS